MQHMTFRCRWAQLPTMECFTGFGGRRRYVPVESVAAVVGTLYRVRDKRHTVLFERETFSVESM